MNYGMFRPAQKLPKWYDAPVKKTGALIVFAVSYAIAFETGMGLYFHTVVVSALWPASGLAIAVYLLFPRKAWHIPALIQFGMHALLSNTGTAEYAVAMAAAAVVESIVGAYTIGWLFRYGPTASIPFRVAVFLLGCGMGSFTGALIGAAGIIWNNDTTVLYWMVLQRWLLADFNGMVLFGPVILYLLNWQTRTNASSPKKSDLEVLLFLLSVWGLTLYVFGIEMRHVRVVTQSPFMIMPVLMWGALRLRLPVVGAGVCGSGLLATILSRFGRGPFIEGEHDLVEAVLGLQVFLAITAGFVWVMWAVMAERQKMVMTLSESERRYRELVEHTRAAIMQLDRSGKIRFFNEYAEKLFGFSSEEVQGKDVIGTIVPQTDHDGNNLADMVAKFIERDGAHYDEINENENITKSGRRLWMAWRNTAEIDENGHFSGILSVGLDMTERHRAETTLRLANRRLRGILDSIESLVHVTDLDTNEILFINEFGKKMYGEVEGENCKEVMQYGNVDACGDCSSEALVDAEGEPTGVKRSEFRNHNDGRWYQMRNRAIQWTDGRMARLQIVTDITAEREAAERERLHREQLVRADKLKSMGVMVGSVAHAVNNPVMTIEMGTENLSAYLAAIRPALDEYWMNHKEAEVLGKSRRCIDEQVQRILRGMHQGCERIASVIKNLRLFARPDEGYLNGYVSVNKVVESAILVCDEFINKSTNCFSTELAEALPDITGNEGHLEQMVVNLITNACQALTGREQRVSVITEYCDDTIILRVCDEGRGISEEALPRVTDPFFTTREDLGGTGIGMAVSAQIIDRHHGRLRYRSEPGRGTTAEVFLPITLNNSRG